MTTLIAFDTATERMTVALQHGERVFAHDGEGGAQGLGDAAAGDLRPPRRCRHRPRRSRCDRLRPRPRRVHRPAHGVLGGAGPGPRRRQARAADRQPARSRRRRARERARRAPRLGADRRPHGPDLRAPNTSTSTAAGRRASRPSSPTAKRSPRAGATSRRWRSPATRWSPSPAAWPPAPRRARPPRRRARSPLLRLAERAWADGAAVDPALALPLYVRDNVAQTTAERERARLAKVAAGAEP